MKTSTVAATLLGTVLVAASLPAQGPAYLVRDVDPSHQPDYYVDPLGVFIPFYGSDPGQFTALDGVMYFVADDRTHGAELWRSDGTEERTTLVKDIRPGHLWGQVRILGTFEGMLLMAASDGVAGGELWRSDGTEAGTSMVLDICPGLCWSLPYPPRAFPGEPVEYGPTAATGGAFYFLASDQGSNAELWRTDGTAAGTYQAVDLCPGPCWDAIWDFAAYAGALYLSTRPSGLWRYDPASGEASFVASSCPMGGSPPPESLTEFGGELYFLAGCAGNLDLYRSDGTAAGTRLVKDLPPLPFAYIAYRMTPTPDLLFFEGPDGLWRSDGTPEGTFLLQRFHSITGMASLGDGRIFVGGYSTARGWSLWASDGTVAGTRQLGPELRSRWGQGPFARGGLLLFGAEAGEAGVELWASDGSTVQFVQDINTGPDSSGLFEPTLLGDLVFFEAYHRGYDLEPWALDLRQLSRTLLRRPAVAARQAPDR
jgi:ELWxxDGT repeat protein